MGRSAIFFPLYKLVRCYLIVRDAVVLILKGLSSKLLTVNFLKNIEKIQRLWWEKIEKHRRTSDTCWSITLTSPEMKKMETIKKPDYG